jgi:hypothetical protein
MMQHFYSYQDAAAFGKQMALRTGFSALQQRTASGWGVHYTDQNDNANIIISSGAPLTEQDISIRRFTDYAALTAFCRDQARSGYQLVSHRDGHDGWIVRVRKTERVKDARPQYQTQQTRNEQRQKRFHANADHCTHAVRKMPTKDVAAPHAAQAVLLGIWLRQGPSTPVNCMQLSLQTAGRLTYSECRAGLSAVSLMRANGYFEGYDAWREQS